MIPMSPISPMSPIARRTLLLGSALLGLTLAAGVAAASTTGSGTARTETRELGGFNAIAMRGDIDVLVRQGAREAVQVSTDDNLLPLLQTVVEGDGDKRTLRISWPKGENVRSRAKTLVTVDVVRLESVALAGSGDVELQALKTPKLALSIAGSSDANLKQLDTEELKVSIAGSGDLQAAGRASKLTISIAGSGDVMARELASDDVTVSIAGSGDAQVRANKTLSVSVAGSGDIEYSGAAVVTRSRIAGSGSIRQRP